MRPLTVSWCPSLQVVDVVHPGRPNVSKEELKTLLAKMYNVSDPTTITLFGFRTQFGGGKSSGFALVYDNITAKKKYEPKYRLVRVRIAFAASSSSSRTMQQQPPRCCSRTRERKRERGRRCSGLGASGERTFRDILHEGERSVVAQQRILCRGGEETTATHHLLSSRICMRVYAALVLTRLCHYRRSSSLLRRRHASSARSARTAPRSCEAPRSPRLPPLPRSKLGSACCTINQSDNIHTHEADRYQGREQRSEQREQERDRCDRLRSFVVVWLPRRVAPRSPTMLGRRGIFKKEKKYTKLVDALYPAELDAPINRYAAPKVTPIARVLVVLVGWIGDRWIGDRVCAPSAINWAT
mgnify:CR=1 FL=1